MAVYKGREVTLIGKVGGADTAPLYTIEHRNGGREDVQMNQIQLTEKEVKESKDGSAWHLDGANVIKDKELQELRDSQDRKKIEENEKKNPQKGFVAADKVYVDAHEVKDKTTITPEMKTAKK